MTKREEVPAPNAPSVSKGSHTGLKRALLVISLLLLLFSLLAVNPFTTSAAVTSTATAADAMVALSSSSDLGDGVKEEELFRSKSDEEEPPVASSGSAKVKKSSDGEGENNGREDQPSRTNKNIPSAAAPKHRRDGDDNEKKSNTAGSQQQHNSLGHRYWNRSDTPAWPKGEVMPAAEVYKYFKNTLVIMMMSPPRYHLVQEVQKHYAPFFRHMVFCGPKNNTNYGVQIHGYDIVFGNMQYLAVKNILKHYLLNETMRRKHEPPQGYEDDESLLGDDHITGMLYIADDLLLHPWAVAAKNYNKNMPWAVQMGIGHIRSWDKVAAVPMMAMESKFRKAGWPYWRRNHGKLNHVLEEGGPEMRERLAEAAKATPPIIYKWSKYNRMNYSQEEANPWTVFYTIIDTYYVPRAMWKGYIDGAELMAKYWVFGECAIATVLRSLHPTFEEMAAQFYWSGGTAADCVRFRWNVHVDCFHRCRHDHVFSQIMYKDDATRQLLNTNATFLKESIGMKGLAEMPFKPMQNK